MLLLLDVESYICTIKKKGMNFLQVHEKACSNEILGSSHPLIEDILLLVSLP